MNEMGDWRPPVGWYPDPDRPLTQRYWDGNAWTEHRTPTPPEAVPAARTPTPDRLPQQDAAPQRRDLAGPGSRLAAIFIDAVFVTACVVVLALPGWAAGPIRGSVVGDGIALLSGLAILSFVVAYHPLAEGRLGQTYGKLLMRIQVVDLRSREQIGVAPAIARMIMRLLGVYALGLGVAWLIWDEQHQGLHDKAVGSLVVTAGGDQTRDPLDHLQAVFSPPR